MPSPAAIPNRRRTAAIFAACSYASLALTAVKILALVPLYLSVLGVEGYGSWVALSALAGSIGMLEGGLSVPFARRIAAAAGGGDRRRFVETCGAGIVVVGAISIALMAFAVFSAPWIVKLVVPIADERFVLAFRLAAVGTVTLLVQASAGAVLLAWQRPGHSGGSRILGVLVEIGAIVLGLQLGLGVVALGLGVVMGAATSLAWTMAALAAGWRTHGLPRPSLVRGELSGLAAEAIPALPLRAGSAVLASADTALISIILGPGAAAQYSITERAVRLGEMVVNPIAGASLSGLAHAVGEKGRSGALPAIRELATVSALASAALLVPWVLLNEGFVGLWVGPEHFLGTPITLALVVAAVGTTRHGVLGVAVQSLGGTLPTAIWSATAAALRTGLIAALLAAPAVGLLSVPLATIVVVGILGPVILGRAASRLGGVAPSVVRPIVSAGVPTMILEVAVFTALAFFMPAPQSWTSLVGEAMAAGIVSATLILGTSTYARRAIAALWHRSSELPAPDSGMARPPVGLTGTHDPKA